jgi:hypothetical protein
MSEIGGFQSENGRVKIFNTEDTGETEGTRPAFLEWNESGAFCI